MYIGMEHLVSNNLPLAEQYLLEALQICDQDPSLFNELGSLYFACCEFDKALSHYEKAHALATSYNLDPSEDIVQSVIMNLGHTHRKLGRMHKAREAFQFVLRHQSGTLSADTANTYCALGLLAHQEGNLSEAVEYYHNALSMAPSHVLAKELLSKSLESNSTKSLIDLMWT